MLTSDAIVCRWGFELDVVAPDLACPGTGEHSWRVRRDLATDVSKLEIVNDQGTFRLEDTGTVIHRDTREWYSFRWNDSTSARGETRTVLV